MTSIWRLPNVYFQNLLLINNTPGNTLQPQMHIFPLTIHTLWAKIGWVSIFLKNWFQIDANDLKLRVAKCIFWRSTHRQQYTRQYPSTSRANLSTPMHPLWAKISWVSIYLKRDSKLTQVTSIWRLPNVYFQNLLLINNTPGNTLQPQRHICPLPFTPFEQKLAESAYF